MIRSLINANDNKATRLTKVLFIIYIAALFWLLLFKLGVQFSYMEMRSVNLVPFRDSFIANAQLDLPEIVLNVLIFIPLGMYAGVLFRNWGIKKKLFFFFLVSLVFETLQFVFKIGAFDITDIITNTSGGVIGLMVYGAIERTFKSPARAQQFINIIAATGTVVMLTLLILLKLNMLPIRYQ